MNQSESPYTHWNPDDATPHQDNKPDAAIVPYVEALRDAGVVTFQSCAGHTHPDGYETDGHLWFEAEKLDPQEVLSADAIYNVLYQYGPEECWVIEFLGMNRGEEYLRETMRALFEELGVQLPEPNQTKR